jgi:hypothetical protein
MRPAAGYASTFVTTLIANNLAISKEVDEVMVEEEEVMVSNSSSKGRPAETKIKNKMKI